MTSNLLLPQIRKEHRRQIKILDSSPSPVLQQEVIQDGDATTGPINTTKHQSCLVCSKHIARYSCPRCEIPYCSLDCFRAHDKAKGKTAGENSSAGYEGGGACTESFYKDRVSSVINLEIKAQATKTQKMIQNVYNDQQKREDNFFYENEQFRSPAKPIRLESPDFTYNFSNEQLASILKALEKDESDSSERLQSLLLSIAPDFQQSFEHSIRNGHLQEWIIEPWHPWWKPEILGVESSSLAGHSDENYDGCENSDDESSPYVHKSRNNKTLDERLLTEVPSFFKLCPKLKSDNIQNATGLFQESFSNRDASPVDLRFNLVDILYSIVNVLRLYHGISNTSCRDNCYEAAETMIQSSAVLSNDARWTVLEEVLTNVCCHDEVGPLHIPESRRTKILNELEDEDNNIATIGFTEQESTAAKQHSSILRDVILILRGNFRFVARALFEGMDILQHAITVNAASARKLKKSEERKNEYDDNSEDVDYRSSYKYDKARARQLKRVRKKMEYFLSWCKYYYEDKQEQRRKQSLLLSKESDSFTTLADGIEEWLQEWDMDTI